VIAVYYLFNHLPDPADAAADPADAAADPADAATDPAAAGDTSP
jgi:hypothetical protein